MAAPEAAWNRLEVPWPATSATVALAAEHPAVRCLPALRRLCAIARKRLSGTGLAVEGRVLRAVLYVYHSRLLRHRPYLALQQALMKNLLCLCIFILESENQGYAILKVEQCLKRLWKMNLVGCIETLADLIPMKNTSQGHAECLVPSQPILETVALKVLGGCKLIMRLLDCCCKAFLLSVKHLCSEEFILLNTVASGLLSRLWIQYRCVLQSLVSLYGTLSTSLDLVSETQQMPYIRGFTFPSDICNFLGVNVSSEMKKQKSRMLTTKKPTSWIKKFFPTMPEAVSDIGKKRSSVTCRSAVKNCSIPCPTDIGEPVLVTGASRGKHLGLHVKSLLRPSRPPAREGISIASTPFKANSASLSSRIAKLEHAGFLVQLVQRATSFGELSEALRKVILWCKGNKFKPEAYFLRNKLLKSTRLHHVEAQGCSLKKKLCCVKTSVRKYLLYGSHKARWPKQHLQAWFCQRRFKSSARLKRTLKTVCQKPPELAGVCEHSASPILPAYQDGPWSQAGCSSADRGCVKLSTAETPKRLLLDGSPGPVWKEATENMDIDSIFASIGV